MTDNVNIAFGKAALLAIALMPAVSWAAEEPAAAVPNDPFIDAVFACHSKYVEDYTSIANTASSIADRAAVKCKKEMDAYERHALLPPAPETAADSGEAEAQRKQLVSLLRESLRTFTMESAVRFGATNE
jgi:hypothetical protein